ncbi:MAG: hypothetical protein KA383_04550 [Phycisphaerae bacterium]|nr:hypothetical protein [Phycisphaerae bacterium]
MFTLLVGALYLEGRSQPSGISFSSLVACVFLPASVCVMWPCGAALLAIYLLKILGCFARRTSAWHDWRWYVLPAVFAIVLHAGYTRWPLIARFEHSRTDFQQQAAALLTSPPATNPSLPSEAQSQPRFALHGFSQRVGLYYVYSVAVYPDLQCVYFVVNDGSVFAGFLYSPTGAEPRPSHKRPLGGGWFTFQYPLGWS